MRSTLISVLSALLMITSLGSNWMAAQESPQATPVVEEAETTAPPPMARNSITALAESTFVLNVDSATFTGLAPATDISFTATLTLGDNEILPADPGQTFSLDGIPGSLPTFQGGLNVFTFQFQVSPDATFTANCTDDNQLVVEASVVLLVGEEQVTVVADPVTVPCSFGDVPITVTPTGEVAHIEVCGPTNPQANDIITLIPQEGVEVDNARWGNGEWLLDLKPAEGYMFTEGSQTYYRIPDTQTECEPSSVAIDETSTALQGVSVGNVVAIPATLTLPSQNPYDVAAITLQPGTGGVLVMDLSPTRGSGGAIPVEFIYAVPTNFSEICSANQGTMPLNLIASLSGPNQNSTAAFTADLSDAGSLPCSLAMDLPTLSVAIDSDAFVNVRLGDTVPVTVTVTIPEGHPYNFMKMDGFVQYAIFGGDMFYQEHTLEVGDSTIVSITYDVPVNEYVMDQCASANELLVNMVGLLYVPTESERPLTVISDREIRPCSVETPVTPDPNQVVHTAVCGVDNDQFTTSQAGVIVSLGGWSEGTNTLTFAPAEGFYFPDDVQESMTVKESTELCLIEGHIPVLTHIEVCGIGNDRFDIESTDVPEGVFIDTSEVWVDGVFRIWVSALPGYELPEGTQTYYEFVDSGPCPVEGLGAPTQTAVCGVNNDEVIVPVAPEGVIVTNTGDWSAESTWTVSYVVEDANYRLPDGMVAEYVFVDEGPCVVTPVPPGPAESVCGPNNDVFTIPGQPDGVVVNDTGWENNRRTISWQPTEHYVFLKNTPLGFTATDENIPCDTEPVGKQVTVVLDTSDNGSIEGTTYTLYAPVASQVNPEPFAEGLVGPDNRIVIQGLMVGDYRLVSSPEGYEPVDTVISVTAGTEPQEITINVAAIQVPVTPEPTVQPTAVPTEEPTVVPTGEATVAPNQTPSAAAVSDAITGLPQTGSSPDTGSIILGLSGLLTAALVAIAIGSLRLLVSGECNSNRGASRRPE